MDPISLGASVIALYQLTSHLLGQLIRYTHAVKTAKSEAQSLMEEIQNFQSVLLLASGMLQDENPNSKEPSDRLKALREILKPEAPLLRNVNADIEKITSRIVEDESKRGGTFRHQAEVLMQKLKWPLKAEEVIKLKDDMGRIRSQISSAQNLDNTQMLRTVDSTTRTILRTVKADQVKRETKEEEDRKKEEIAAIDELKRKIVAWLRHANQEESHDTAMKSRSETSNTGRWFLDGEKFSEWKSSKHALLWLHGDPGCGKTVLSSTIIENLRKASQSESKVALAFWYFTAGEKAKTNANDFVRGLITQLLRAFSTKIPPAIDEFWKSTGKNDQVPKASELNATLRRIIAEEEMAFYIVIDALDEVREDEVKDVFTILTTLLDHDLPDIHVLVTSRQAIKERFENHVPQHTTFYDIGIERAHVDEDIRDYMKEQLTSDPVLSRCDDSLKTKISDTLLEKAEGMFRWVDCQLQALRKCKKRSAFDKVLNTLPKNLEEQYKRELLVIGEGSNPADLLNLLKWLTFPRRKLRVEEVVDILAVDYEDDDDVEELTYNRDDRYTNASDLIAMCGSLVRVEQNEDGKNSLGEASAVENLTTAHNTVLEFLKSQPVKVGELEEVRLTSAKINRQMALTSLAYLFSMFHEEAGEFVLLETISKYPAARLCAELWDDYYREAISDPREVVDLTQLNSMIIHLLDSKPDTLKWVQICDPDNDNAPVNLTIEESALQSPLYYASLLGLPDIVKHYLKEGLDVNLESDSGIGSILGAAVYEKRVEVVKILLAAGASIQSGGFWSVGKAVAVAVAVDSVEILKEFMSLESFNVDDVRYDWNLRNGKVGSEATEAEEPATEDTPGETATSEQANEATPPTDANVTEVAKDAGSSGNNEAQESAETNTEPGDGEAEDAPQDVERQERGADAEKSQDNDPEAPDQTNGDGEAVVDEASAAVEEAEDDWEKDEDALVAAAVETEAEAETTEGEPQENGVESARGQTEGIDAEAADGETQEDDEVRTQEDEGNATEGNGVADAEEREEENSDTPEAAEANEAPADDTDQRERCSETLLYIAARYASPQAFDMLLDANADVNKVGGSFMTPLRAAGYVGSNEMVEKLLDKGAAVDIYGGAGGSALICACYGQIKLDLVKRIVDAGCVITQPEASKIEHNVLYVASRFQTPDVVRYLCENGGNVNDRGNGEYDNCLQAACVRGDVEVVKVLLEFKADMTMQGAGEYDNCLVAAIVNAHSAVVDALLAAGMDPNIEGGVYKYPILASAFQTTQTNDAQDPILRSLLQYKADPYVFQEQEGTYDNAYPAQQLYSKGAIDVFCEFGVDLNRSTDVYVNLLSSRLVTDDNLDTFNHVLTKDVDVNHLHPKFGRVLTLAVRDNKVDAIRRLVQEDSLEIDAMNEYAQGGALHLAANKANMEIVELLLDSRANINAEHWLFGPPLLSSTSEAITEYLLERGADPARSNYLGQSVLHRSVIKEHFGLIDKLLSIGVDRAAKDKTGTNALHLAARTGNLTAVLKFIDLGLDINEQDEYGWTPLHWACAATTSGTVVIKELLSRQAQSDLKDIKGYTALDYAKGFHRAEEAAAILYPDFDLTDQVSLTLEGKDTINNWVSYYCDSCGLARGDRYRCTKCESYDLCFRCYEFKDKIHDPEHEWNREFEQKLFLPDAKECLNEVRPNNLKYQPADGQTVTRSGRTCHLENTPLEDEESRPVLYMKSDKPLLSSVPYFEIKAKDIGENNALGIGLSSKTAVRAGMPGWELESYGYHSDDGKFFVAVSTDTSFGHCGETWVGDDVIGCGVSSLKPGVRTIFYTKNGKKQGQFVQPFEPGCLYPMVCMSGVGTAGFRINFGSEEFVWKGEDAEDQDSKPEVTEE